MTNEAKLIQENIKLFVLYQSLEKMTYFPSIKLKLTMDAGQLPTEMESSIYYILKLTTEVLKSYMEDKSIPVYTDNSLKNDKELQNNKFLTHSDFSYGLSDIIKLYQLLNDERLKTTDFDMIGQPSKHPLSEYRCHTAYNHAVYFDAYMELSRLKKCPSEDIFFSQHPLLNPNEYFTLI